MQKIPTIRRHQGRGRGYLQVGGGAVGLVGVVGPVGVGLAGLARRGSTPRVPDGGPLQEHLLPVSEGVAALAAACARGVEVVVVAGLHTHRHTHYYYGEVCASKDIRFSTIHMYYMHSIFFCLNFLYKICR